MSIKDVIASDISDVFFVEDDFADWHTLNGIELLCIVDDDRMISRSDKAFEGTQLGEKLIFVKAADLPGKPMVDGTIDFDGRLWIIRNAVENMGVYEIRLGVCQGV